MRKTTILILLIFCISSLRSYSQGHGSVSGTILDTTEHVVLSHASTSILRSEDSVLTSFTYSDQNGHFELGRIPFGSFILLIEYPNYVDFVEKFTIDSADTTHAFSVTGMQAKAKLLQEIIVKAKTAAIVIKGDTTEYRANSFVIQPNAKVEDLLKQLPGIEVDNQGKISAFGQSVTRVLVDGEEFFNDDPTLVTRNVRADMVAKIQVYDKKSDQSVLTGAEDGKRTKTINVVLKEDKNAGTFGKANIGGGTKGYFETR